MGHRKEALQSNKAMNPLAESRGKDLFERRNSLLKEESQYPESLAVPPAKDEEASSMSTHNNDLYSLSDFRVMRRTISNSQERGVAEVHPQVVVSPLDIEHERNRRAEVSMACEASNGFTMCFAAVKRVLNYAPIRLEEGITYDVYDDEQRIGLTVRVTSTEAWQDHPTRLFSRTRLVDALVAENVDHMTAGIDYVFSLLFHGVVIHINILQPI